MSLPGTVIEESHENDDDKLASLTWQEIAEESMNIAIFERVIEEFNTEPENEEDKLPEQLLEVANTILYISLGIKSVKNHKEDFERLLGQAASLVVVFWQSYVKLGIPGSMWPPPYLREVIDILVITVYSIHKLMKRKSKKSYTKRILVGYFGLRDLGKFKKYQRKLGSVASGFENEPNNVNINEVLLKTIKNRARHPIEDEDIDEVEDNELSEDTAEPVRMKRRVAEENRTAKKITNRRQPNAQSEPKGTRGTNFDKTSKEKRTRYQESDEDVEEGTSSSGQGSRTNNAAQSKTKKRVSSLYDDEEYDKEKPINDRLAPKGQLKQNSVSTPKQKAKSVPPQYSISDFTFNNGVEGSTSRQGSRTNNATQPKAKKRVDPVHDDDEEYDVETPDVDPVPLERQAKKKKKPISTPKQEAKSAPVSPQYSISGFAFNNGSGYMTNQNVGNIYNSTIEDAFNDNSVNVFNGKRKPA